MLEYLDGETLAARLQKGPLPLDQALRYAIEIADALDKAHRQGITHRDLKPGNVMLTKAGTKLLDFGLAKLRPAATGAIGGTDAAPTRSTSLGAAQGEPLTGHGTMLGTLPYMAPEQLEGGDVDARTDIFAFGAVVYEMATGKRAFAGRSQASVIAAILEHDPPPIAATQPVAPPALDHVVTKCLVKDPDARWQSAKDLCDELTWIAEGGSQAASTTAVRASRRGNRERAAWALGAVAAAAAIALGTLYLRSTPTTDAPPIRLSVAPPQDGTFQSTPAVSPDGRRLAFVASRAGVALLWVRSLDSLDAQPLPGTEGANVPF